MLKSTLFRVAVAFSAARSELIVPRRVRFSIGLGGVVSDLGGESEKREVRWLGLICPGF